jgi:hypothetical protein
MTTEHSTQSHDRLEAVSAAFAEWRRSREKRDILAGINVAIVVDDFLTGTASVRIGAFHGPV